jgi:hypothetical protein
MTSNLYPMGFPTKFVSWKGKAFYQVVASIQKNGPTISSTNVNQSVNQWFHPLPLKIYRREIHDVGLQIMPKNCNPRISVKISDFETPGNNIVSKNARTYSNGLVVPLDMELTTLSAEHGVCNNSNTCFLSPQQNAKKRFRKRKFNK